MTSGGRVVFTCLARLGNSSLLVETDLIWYLPRERWKLTIKDDGLR